MHNEYNPVNVEYKKHDKYELHVLIDKRYVKAPMVSVKTLEPLEACAAGDKIDIGIQTWVLMHENLDHLITAEATKS